MKKQSNVDTWLKRNTPEKQKCLENAAKQFNSSDSLNINVLKALYGTESSFGSTRRKPGIKGAAGDFQLEQATARRFGLKITKTVDERFDVNKSIAAGAAYLKNIDDMLRQGKNVVGELKMIKVPNATERLKFTLAAYNGGEGRIARAQGAAKLAGEDPTKWDLVKNYLIAAGASATKSKEIQNYVQMILEYAEDFFQKSNKDQNKSHTEKGEHWITKGGRHILIKDE